MRSFAGSFIAIMAIAALGACSSSGGGTPDPALPILDGDGNVAGASNFILTDISYGHPSSGDGVDETFDLAVTTMKLKTDNPSGGLSLLESTRGTFDDGNTMAYDASDDTFTFMINSGNVVLNETFDNVMLADPVDVGYEFNDEAIVISSNPALFSGFGFDSSDLGNPGGVNAFLIGLEESEDEADQELLTDIRASVTEYIADSDYYYYSSNGVSYSQLKLNNAAGTTNYTTLGIWTDGSVDGEENIGVAVWGNRTPRYEVPTTGTASYSATMAGHILQNNNTQFLTGGINFDFNFAAQTMNFTMDANIAETGIDGTTDYFDYDTFTGSGNVYVDTFLGDFVSDSDDSLIGELEGAFFGADADEVAGTFVFGNKNVQGIGGFVGANPESQSQNN